MRKGVTLLELVVTLGILAAASVAVAILFRTLVADIPRVKKVIDVNAALTEMLVRMQEDVDAASSLPAAIGGRKADEKTLLLRRPEGTVCYQLGSDRVTRSLRAPEGGASWQEKNAWRVPNADIQWRVRQTGGRRDAVEVRTGVYLKTNPPREKRLVNARVFFLGAAGPSGGRP